MRILFLSFVVLAACGSSGSSGVDAGADACVDPETEAQACTRLVAECGAPVTTDACGVERTLACGECTAPEECVANECRIPSVTFVSASPTAQSNGTMITLAKPSDLRAGDLLIAFVQSYGGSVDGVASEGWTVVRFADQGSQIQHNILSKRIGAVEPADYTFTSPDAFSGVGFILAYRGARQTNPIEAEAVSDLPSGSTYDSPSPTVTPTASFPNRVLVTFHSVFYAGTIGTTPVFSVPAGMTERLQVGAPSSSDPRYDAVAVFEETLTTVDPATRTSTVTLTCTNCYARKMVNALLLAP
jgi:hypothetical protein